MTDTDSIATTRRKNGVIPAYDQCLLEDVGSRWRDGREPLFWKDRLMRATGRVHPAEHGSVAVEQFKVEKKDQIGQIGSFFSSGRMCPPGTYTRLLERSPKPDGTGFWSTLWMSDTPDELCDQWWALDDARGRVLVNGLGLGCTVFGMLSMRWQKIGDKWNENGTGQLQVKHIDVVEKSHDVIELIGPYLPEDRVTIHEGDALTFQWPKGTRWDFAWHDIWPDLCVDYLAESYATLHRRYGRRVTKQKSWGFKYLQSRR